MANATCIDCSRTFTPQSRGRPRKRCFDCSPRHQGPSRIEPRRCARCESEFHPKAGRQRFCTSECQVADQKVACAGCKRPIFHGATSLPEGEATCQPCRRKTVHGRPGSYRYKGCRCDLCVEAVRAEARKHQARARARGYERPGRPRLGRKCDWCGKEITSRSGNAKDGLTLCQQHRTEKRGRDLRNATRRRAFRQIAERAAAGTSGGGRVWVQGDCLVCSEPFVSPGIASRYCSRECRRVARSGSRWISYEDRRAIYLRDDWLCQICGEATSRKYNRDDPWSPTLDHVIPRSLGGSDEPENCRLAHLWCNSVRGDLSHYTDVDLQEVA